MGKSQWEARYVFTHWVMQELGREISISTQVEFTTWFYFLVFGCFSSRNDFYNNLRPYKVGV